MVSIIGNLLRLQDLTVLDRKLGKNSLLLWFKKQRFTGGRLLKSPKWSCILRTLERDAQAINQNMGHSNEPGARAADKGTLAPLEEHLSRFLSAYWK